MYCQTQPSSLIAALTAAFLSSTALAQTTPLNQSSRSTAVARATHIAPTTWMTQLRKDQWRMSKMLGLNVYNSLNEKIGIISDLIVDENGAVEALVIGVGGFLGLGEHDVAVPFREIEWSYQPVTSSGALDTPPTVTSAPSGQKPENANTYPNHAFLNMSKDQLRAAPVFKFSVIP
jgi:sporulation protein YlmC with PRC-barrel domain